MPRTGRPRLDDAKDKVVCIRMRLGDYKRLKEYAETLEKTVTQVVQEGVNAVLENVNA